MSLAFPMKFDLLEKFRRALFRSDGAEPGVRNPAEADYLVKMNIPPCWDGATRPANTSSNF